MGDYGNDLDISLCEVLIILTKAMMTQNWAEICWLVLVVYGICVYICSGFNFF